MTMDSWRLKNDGKKKKMKNKKKQEKWEGNNKSNMCWKSLNFVQESMFVKIRES